MAARQNPLDRDRSHDLVVLKSGIPIRRVPSPLARRFAQICAAANAEMASDSGLTSLQFGALVYLFDEPGIDQNGLAARLGIDRTSASQLIDQLEAKGLLERRVNGADRRAKLLRLTGRGRKLREQLRPKAHRINAHLLDALTPAEREMFLELLVRVIEANEAYARPGAGRRKPVKYPKSTQNKQ